MVIRSARQCRRNRATTAKIPAVAAMATAVTSRRPDRTTERSAPASIVKSRAGVATLNASRVSTVRPSCPRYPRRPMTYPTAITVAITVNPVRTPCMSSQLVDRGRAAQRAW